MRPFVGRDGELARLRAALAGVRDGDGTVLLVSGPAGIGKSRLVAEALADPAPPAVGRGFCDPTGADPPLWPWVRAIRSAARRAGPEGGALRAAVDGALSRQAPEVSHPGSASAARAQWLAEVAETLLDATAQQPLTLVLEDLHWADAGTLDLLREVARDLAGSALLVLGTHRDPPVEAVDALGDLRRADRVQTLSLQPLGLPDVRRYFAGRSVDARRVLRLSQGLPLLLEAAACTPDASPAGGGAAAEAGRFVGAALARLPADQVRVIRAAAILGPQVDAELVAAVLAPPGTATVPDAEQVAVAAALDAGLSAGLLERDPERPVDTARRFAHALWRDAVVAGIDPAPARLLHRRAADALVGRADVPSHDAARIAGHLHVAGEDAATLLAAADWSRTAARAARRALAYPECAGHLSRVVDALERAGAGPVELAEALVEAAAAAYLAGTYLTALDHCRRAGLLAAQEHRADLVAAAALTLQGVTFSEAGPVISGLARTALELGGGEAAGGLDPVTDARLHAQLATMAAAEGDVAQASEHAAQAMAGARAAGDPRALLEAARAVDLTSTQPWQVPDRLALGELAVAQATALDDPVGAVLGLEWRLSAAVMLGRLEVADEAEQRIAALADRTRLPLLRWHLVRVRAARAALAGRLDEARAFNAEATGLASSSGDSTAVGMSVAHRVHLALLSGDACDAEDLTQRWGSVTMPLILASTARLWLLQGERDLARQCYERVRPLLERPVRSYTWGGLLCELAHLVEAFADGGTAALLVPELQPYTGYAGAAGTATAYFSGNLNREYGLALAAAGRPAEARAAVAEAVRRSVALGARPHVVLAQLDLAALILRSGADPVAATVAEAGSLAREAAAEARRLGMPGSVARADGLLAQVAALAREADPLSHREREVAELVVRALSNREIARRLVLSERTVESHVRSILAKLGCANRTELVIRRNATSRPGPAGPGA